MLSPDLNFHPLALMLRRRYVTAYVPDHDQACCSLRAVWKVAGTLPDHVEVIAQGLVIRALPSDDHPELQGLADLNVRLAPWVACERYNSLVVFVPAAGPDCGIRASAQELLGDHLHDLP